MSCDLDQSMVSFFHFAVRGKECCWTHTAHTRTGLSRLAPPKFMASGFTGPSVLSAVFRFPRQPSFHFFMKLSQTFFFNLPNFLNTPSSSPSHSTFDSTEGAADLTMEGPQEIPHPPTTTPVVSAFVSGLFRALSRPCAQWGQMFCPLLSHFTSLSMNSLLC